MSDSKNIVQSASPKGKAVLAEKNTISQLAAPVPQFVNVGAAPSIVFKRKRRSKLSLYLQVFLLVVLPTLIATTYYGFIASDRYVSSTQIVIQSNKVQDALGLSSLVGGSAAGLMGGGGSGSQGDILATYIESTSMVSTLQDLLSLRDMYAPDSADELSKLRKNASNEEFLEYYQNRTSIQWDAQTSLLSIETEAFTPHDAKLIIETIIMVSEEKLNSLTERKQKDLVAFANDELARAEERLTAARLAVTGFRQKYGEINPVSAAEATGGLLARIQGQLSAERVQLGAMLFALKSDSPQIKALRVRIQSLETQAIEEKKRLTGKSGVVLSDLVSEYEGLLIEEEFARAIYTSALAFLESTRAKAQQEASYVIDFVSANLPDEATQPTRLIIIITVFVVSLLVFGISQLIAAAIKEQAKL